jgi:hypothetical protein
MRSDVFDDRFDDLQSLLERQLVAAKAELRVTESELGNARTQLNGITSEAKNLEGSLAPRRLFFITWEDGTTNLDMLKPLADTEFIVESIPDFEACKAAGEITGILKEAHLNVIQTAITKYPMWDGVTVERYTGPVLIDPIEQMRQEMDSGKRAEVVEAFLWANGWKEVHGSGTQRGELKSNELRIRVGFKPSPFFRLRAPGLQQMDEAEARMYGKYAQPIDKIKKRITQLVESSWKFPDSPK